ncbi:MAG: site-specific DNA-methyltransferase, partial [Firmicutes bacterium]|nr:site-specific DNA-methyltransferase [Bacillota bacterium]
MKDILFRLPEIYRAAEERYNEIIERIQEADGGFDVTEIFAGGGENRLVRGDNLKYMESLLREGYAGKIDMIYADPPFFSKSDYTINVKVGNQKGKLTLARSHAFTDRWEDGMAEYLETITLAMMLTRDLLAETGSLFVHLDWHSSHYLKVILDQVFGEKNFINEIVWTYKSGGASKRTFARKHDVVLFYSKSKSYFFEVQQEKSYNRDMKPYRFKGVREYRDEIGWYTLVSMKDVWQIDMVGRTSSERTGYATQKPEALLKRILDSVTREGDLCADFYCGSGTLGAVCEKT